MFNFFIHKGNANQNIIGIPYHLSEWLSSRKQQMLVRMWGIENPYTLLIHCSWECKLVQNPWKSV
jgi:hypothetical protein